ncbi:MAG: zinc ABC transporter substrate-binding protein, partial [Gammaproteobacteria bacterium]
MKRQLLPHLLALVLLPLNLPAAMRVFSCEPGWAALVTELAGEHAEVFSATTAQQDPHYIQARPSLIARMRRADLVVCTGAELETGWL